MDTFVFKHESLGELHGLSRDSNFIQFRGIPFADIPARFRQSVLRTSLPNIPFDARQPGYICPQPTNPIPELWSGPLAKNGVTLQQPQQDELRCLNLNITVPTEALGSNKRLPVLVYIHGGGFVGGSSSLQIGGRELNDAYNLSVTAASLGKPLVVVTINYRVGPLGFLASKELALFNKSRNEAVGNYGLHDQRRGLEWIVRFVAAFGGDPENLTIMGGSAGAVACHFQTTFPDPVFKRAILSSGTVLSIGAMPLDHHQTIFETLANRHGDPSHPLEVLQMVSAQNLVQQQPTVFYNPVIDGTWIRGRGMEGLVYPAKKLDIMLGSCDFEQDVTHMCLGSTDQMMKTNILSMLRPVGITTNVEFYFERDILKSYGIGSAEPTLKDADMWAEYLADLIFRTPPWIVANNLSERDKYRSDYRCYLYDFQATNPFPVWTTCYGKAGHAINDVFLFDPAGDLVPPKHQNEYGKAVQKLQSDYIDFCYGDLSWPAFESIGPIHAQMNYGKTEDHESLKNLLGTSKWERWSNILDLVGLE